MIAASVSSTGWEDKVRQQCLARSRRPVEVVRGSEGGGQGSCSRSCLVQAAHSRVSWSDSHSCSILGSDAGLPGHLLSNKEFLRPCLSRLVPDPGDTAVGKVVMALAPGSRRPQASPEHGTQSSEGP